MSQSRPPISDDSTRDVFGDWNLFGPENPDVDSGDDSLFPPAPTDEPGVNPPSRPPDPAPVFREPDAPFHDFTLAPDPEEVDPNDSLLGAAGPLGGPKQAAHSPQNGASGGVAPPAQTVHVSRGAPKKGDVIGGFRVVTELGRGAFARVYLAEQIELGNRLVALKVSRAEGEEPQALARLQHTNIVPIHSVHDDPETGMRLMCMPYLGGANLAQVLEAVGPNPTSGNAGLSLVAALDEVSQRYQSQAGAGRGSLFGKSRAASKTAGLPTSEAAPPGNGPRSSERRGVGASFFPPSFGRGSIERIQQLWDRFTRRHAAAGARPTQSLDDRDFDQPARQFLREANTIQATTWIIARLAEGLEHAHSRGLLHRDLKPSNVLIAGDGTPMLLDFNLSSPARVESREEGERVALGGTLPYMSPEHLDAFNPDGATAPEAVDERSDIYALGLIFYEMLAGEHPFPEPRSRPLSETIRALIDMRRQPPSPRAANPLVPWSLDAVVGKCLAFDPSKRYARARELAEDLNRFLDDLPLKNTPEPSLRERLAKWARRNPRLCGNTSIAGFAALLIISLGGLIGLLHGNMQNLAARLKLQVFRNEWAESRFLLDVVSGPAEHLGRGIDLAGRALDLQRIDPSGRWRSDSWANRLTAREQAEVRRQTAELILLAARAKVALAGRHGGAAARKAAEQEAVQQLFLAERLDPAPPAALYGDRARYLAHLGRDDLAANDRAQEAKKTPTTARDFALLGSALLSRGDLPRAESALRKAVDLDPKAFWAWFALGHCHFEQGRPLDAAADFTACVALEPKFAWPHLNRGLALARAGRLNEARTAYQQALHANPRFAEAWLNRALVDLELNNLQDAEQALGQSLAFGARDDPGVLATWAEVKSRTGHRAAAERLFERALAERPDDPVLLTARGVFRVPTDPAGARADLERALRADSRNPRAHYGLALLLRKSDPRAALAEAEAALRDDPNFLDALQARAVLRARLGDLAAIGDAERLSLIPTPHRLYNAACALSLLAANAGETRLISRAIDLLDQALDAGFSSTFAATDPDLKALYEAPAFRAVLNKPRPHSL